MENNQQLPVAEQQSLEQLTKNFYFLIFQPNPAADNVRVIVDEGHLKFSMRRERFYNLIESVMGKSILGYVQNACTVYGEYFLLDRYAKTVQRLHVTKVNEHLNPADIAKELHASIERNKENELKRNVFQDFFDKNSGIKNSGIQKNVSTGAGFVNYSSR